MDTSFKTVKNVIDAIKRGDLTIADLVKDFLQTIEQKNSSLNAIVTLASDESIDRSLKHIEMLKKSGKELPPLTGFPVAIKDLENTKGLLTTHGSPILKNNIPTFDSPMVKNLKGAGCIIIGKTNVPEFGVGSQTFNPIYGATRNPIDISLTAGGSSGGAAAAVASQMLPFADGSDMMGSLRNPAAFCSLFGFRPTPNLVPSEISNDNLPKLSSLGGIAKTTKCLSYLLDAQIGNFNKKKSDKIILSELLDTPLSKHEIRLGWLGSFNGAYRYEREIESLCIDYLQRLQSKGVIVDEVFPNFSAEKLWESWTNLRCKSIKLNLEEHYFNPKTQNHLKTEIIWEIEKCLSLRAVDFETSLDHREDWLTYLDLLFNTYDFLVLPSTQVFPFSADVAYPSEIAGVKLDTYHRWMEVVVPASLAGLPTMSIPCGYNTRGLPAGIQLIGNSNDDLNVLKASNFFEKLLA